jgi:hypothetical protein
VAVPQLHEATPPSPTLVMSHVSDVGPAPVTSVAVSV